MADYPWYELVESTNEILQGEIVDNCPIVIPSSEINDSGLVDVDVEIKIYNVVVLSQSCDLEASKIDTVLVAPFWSFLEIEAQNSAFVSKKNKEKFRQGFIPGYHLLNKCELSGIEKDFIIVDFKNVYGVNLNFLRSHLSKVNRARLLPPYREHLSQSFARHFMRVGLPIGIKDL